MKITDRKLAKLMKESARKKILSSLDSETIKSMHIFEYASEIFKKYCIEKTFPKIILLEATLKNGKVMQRLFETDQLEFLLSKGNNLAAIEAVRCWLIMWADYDKGIKFFGTTEEGKK